MSKKNKKPHALSITRSQVTPTLKTKKSKNPSGLLTIKGRKTKIKKSDKPSSLSLLIKAKDKAQEQQLKKHALKAKDKAQEQQLKKQALKAKDKATEQQLKKQTLKAKDKATEQQLKKQTLKAKDQQLKEQDQALKAKNQQLKEQEQALKAKDQQLKEYQKAIQKSSRLMKEVTETLAQQLTVAQEIHHILLPSELPVIPDCEFSFKFQPAGQEGHGKDFYEISPHPACRSFSLTLSSSASHSLSALLFSARLKMMSRTERGKPLLPEAFLNQLRAEMLPLKQPSSLSLAKPGSQKNKRKPLHTIRSTKDHQIKHFHTLLEKGSLFHALINQKTYQMFYSLVGDISAFVQYAESGNISALKKSAPLLRAKRKKPYHSFEWTR